MRARVVIGANFGDEGKGLVTDYLCAQGAGMVVRFNGGAQAGHTVVTPEGERHVFRHIGSGTFLGVPTFLSQFFVCNPILFFEERKELIALGFHSTLYAHPDCLVTTFVDMLINQQREDARGKKRHGSCGIGFHETITRSKVPHLKITMGDLWNGMGRLKSQLDELCHKYFPFRTHSILAGADDWIAHYLECCEHFANCVEPMGIGQCKDPVFEGAQGLLLDMDNKDFFPHVTHSKTGMHNVRILCQQAGITDIDLYYVSRTYLTRHGYGPLPGEDPALSYADDTNHETQYQGKLRFARLDENLLLRCASDAGSGQAFKLVLTHCDQCEPPMSSALYSNGETRNHVKPLYRSEAVTVTEVL